MESLIAGLASFAHLDFVVWMVAGVIVGLIFGIIPGIGGMTALALFLPFTFVLPPEQSLPFMMAVMSCSNNGGSVTAILVGTPGVPTSAATVLDGFEMTKKGQGGRALGAMLTASAAGGVASVVLALGMVFLVLPMVMAITSADMVFIVLVGLAFIATLARGSMRKSLISAGLGLLISFIGYQPVSGVYRLVFNFSYLIDGVPMIPVALGVFAMPGLIALAARGGSIATMGNVVTRMSDVWQGAKDVLRHWWLWLRSMVIGYIIGVIPGIGAEVAIWVCYGQAKQSSKYPEKFGTGVVEGVIAPESAGNGKEGGATLTTFALGLPGSAVMALILGGLMMAGIQPGPAMINEHMPLTFSLLLVVAAANLVATGLLLVAAPHVARIANIPSRFLAPLLLTTMVFGTYVSRGEILDIVTLLVFGALGIVMSKMGYNLPVMFIGYVLGPMFEHYLFMSLRMAGPLFFLRPISLVLIFLFIAILSYGPASKVAKHWFKRGVKPA